MIERKRVLLKLKHLYPRREVQKKGDPIKMPIKAGMYMKIKGREKSKSESPEIFMKTKELLFRTGDV